MSFSKETIPGDFWFGTVSINVTGYPMGTRQWNEKLERHGTLSLASSYLLSSQTRVDKCMWVCVHAHSENKSLTAHMGLATSPIRHYGFCCQQLYKPRARQGGFPKQQVSVESGISTHWKMTAFWESSLRDSNRLILFSQYHPQL